MCFIQIVGILPPFTNHPVPVTKMEFAMKLDEYLGLRVNLNSFFVKWAFFKALQLCKVNIHKLYIYTGTFNKLVREKQLVHDKNLSTGTTH